MANPTYPPMDDAQRAARRAEQAGVDVRLEVVPDMVHVFHNFASHSPVAQAAVDRLGDFVATHLGTSRA